MGFDLVGDELELADRLQCRVGNLILATKKHDGSLDQDAAVMVDVDLSILGQEPKRFDEYENQIGREYNWVSQSELVVGRTAILKTFLDRPSIYSTDFFRNRYEQQARENLNRSILKLQNLSI